MRNKVEKQSIFELILSEYARALNAFTFEQKYNKNVSEKVNSFEIFGKIFTLLSD